MKEWNVIWFFEEGVGLKIVFIIGMWLLSSSSFFFFFGGGGGGSMGVYFRESRCNVLMMHSHFYLLFLQITNVIEQQQPLMTKK